MISNEGAVSAGMLKGVQCCVVFLLSAILFCSEEGDANCVTPEKLFSVAAITTGLYIYSR